MVQPKESSAAEYNPCEGGPGDTSLGKPEVLPPELTSNEAFQRIWAENHDLRAALEQSNMMLRKGHGDMLEFQDSQRKEREFITYKFGEARDLVLRLTNERNSLQAQLEEAMKQLAEVREVKSRGSTENEQGRLEDTILTDRRSPRKAYEEQKENGNKEVCMENEIMQGTVDRNSRTEQEFQKKLQDAEARNTQFLRQIADLQEEVSKLRRQVVEKGEESQKQLQSLQLQMEQLSEERNSVKAQVTSLLGELKESQTSLEICLQEKRKVEDSLRSALEEKKGWEAQVKQQVVQLDQRMMQVQNLETALKMERQNATDEKRKLAQLQVAYHTLFQEYDTHIKVSMQQAKHTKGVDLQIQELKQQLQEAEEALVAKQALIDKLKDEAEKQRTELDTVPVLKAQVEIYRADFLAERKAREELHAEKERLQEQLNVLLQERLSNRAMIDEMRNRHSDTLRPTLPHGPSLYPLQPAMPFQPEVEPPDFSCPKCFYKAPDMDTLQIHVMDCIQ
ncbi:NF-kappa-B essential modulator [Xenopus tropicalis]|uniref:NF-kappa-B essential modulator n=1 Tax=Xenopus tropicalis TaxID=8364 RepID=B0K002_XENTR|nr:NF-kappa-B essential modulator [Xenopus tropicalis]AAI59401.1 LOC100145270 protein [Xenopus tropicalis]|eukprot:NP_001120221.1 NF-kappa-B essential modulator [Xenopus tropicalis]